MDASFKVAALQMNCVPFDVSRNLDAASYMVREAAGRGAALAVLPELFDTGYRVEEKDRELAGAIPGFTTERMAVLSRENGIFIAGAILENDGGVIYDTAFLTGPDGLVGKYRKHFLWDKERARFSTGDAYPVFDLGFCRLGLQICYELGFPEGARILALRGADIIAYPSAFGMPRLYAWDIASRARALENGVYLIACNRSGTEAKETVFAGNSRIVDPKGAVIVHATKEYETIIAEVDMENVRRQREAIPYLEDLRKNFVAATLA